MKYYSQPTLTNEELQPGRLYPIDANDYLSSCLNSSIVDPDLMYQYCLFWRFLYENYQPSWQNEWVKLEIIRETCRGNVSPNTADIELEMNSAMTGWYGAFDTMDEAIRTFAKCAYFNNPGYNLWNPPPLETLYNNPPLTDSLLFGENDPIQGYIMQDHNVTEFIPHPWGIDYLRYDFLEELGLPCATLTFNRDTDSNNVMRDFCVDVYVVDTTTYQITDYPLVLTPGQAKGQVTFNLNPNVQGRAVVAISLLDASESNPMNDIYYNVKIEPAITLEIKPIYPPVIIGPTGGKIRYNITAINHSNSSVSPDIWCEITDPDGTNPVLTYRIDHIDIAAADSFVIDTAFDVDANYNPGSYHLNGYAGKRGIIDAKWDRDYFPFKVADSDAAPDTMWTNHYGTTNSIEFGYDAIEMPNGHFYGIGSSGGYPLNCYAYRLDVYPNGVLRDASINSQVTVGYGICNNLYGGYAYAGEWYYGNYFSVYVGEVSSGHLSEYYHEIGGSSIGAYDIQPSNFMYLWYDSYIITGYQEPINNQVGDLYLSLVCPGSLGTLWQECYGGSNTREVGYSVKQTFDNGYVAVGYISDEPVSDYDVYMVKTNESGILQWEHSYHPEPDRWDLGYGVVQTADSSGYVIAGVTDWLFGGVSPGYGYLFYVDSLGTKLWEQKYDVGIFRDICKCDSGGYIMAGYQPTALQSENVLVVRVDGGGNQIWQLSIDCGGAYPSTDEGMSIRQTEDGGYIIAGGTKGQQTIAWDFLMVRIEPETFANRIFGLPPDYEIVNAPKEFDLGVNYPNPFNGTTTIPFTLPKTCKVELSLFNSMGQKVATLADGWREAGVHQVTFDGSGLASGMYLARLTAGEFSATQKLILLK